MKEKFMKKLNWRRYQNIREIIRHEVTNKQLSHLYAHLRCDVDYDIIVKCDRFIKIPIHTNIIRSVSNKIFFDYDFNS